MRLRKMAKRTNPFTDDFIPQSKIHVGMKQYNNNEDRLKKVYEKTLELLFKGAKKTTVVESSKKTVPTCKDNMKQLFIGKNGNLSHSGTIVETKNSAVKDCKCGGSSVVRCAYCERVVCGKCERHCIQCDQSYCSLCSLIGSEGAEVCVSCYS